MKIAGLQLTGGLIAWNSWTHLAFSISHTTVSIVRNNAVDSQAEMSEPFVDDILDPHVFGDGFIGFLYEFCVYTYSVTSFPIALESECAMDECTRCPGIKTCLSSCKED
jgi:hypothetical protein